MKTKKTSSQMNEGYDLAHNLSFQLERLGRLSTSIMQSTLVTNAKTIENCHNFEMGVEFMSAMLDFPEKKAENLLKQIHKTREIYKRHALYVKYIRLLMPAYHKLIEKKSLRGVGRVGGKSRWPKKEQTQQS